MALKGAIQQYEYFLYFKCVLLQVLLYFYLSKTLNAFICNRVFTLWFYYFYILHALLTEQEKITPAFKILCK